ncbi:hypothetical protein ACFLZL_03750 [Thermodesulfobacteriota bacterium]
MNHRFQPNCLPTLIGSLPLNNHNEAVRLVFEYTPDIPIWAQLPVFPAEGMVQQFLPGMPGLTTENEKVFIHTAAETFDDSLLGFYEDFMAVTDGEKPLSDSRFALQPDTAGGFFALTDYLEKTSVPTTAVKGQVTGPFTFCTGISDQNGRAIFYDPQLRDVGVKLLAQKARWQVQQLSRYGGPPIIFFDEPGLAGFGSSEFISVSPEDIKACFEEVFGAVHSAGGLAGVHVCANTDWSMVLDSSADIVNFDAYAYFDRFLLYAERIQNFIASGKILALGIVPTLNREDIEKENVDSLENVLAEKIDTIAALGIDRQKILSQTLITPSCGAGSLSIALMKKVLEMTRDVSERFRSEL